jgi:hypothetical protein
LPDSALSSVNFACIEVQGRGSPHAGGSFHYECLLVYVLDVIR